MTEGPGERPKLIIKPRKFSDDFGSDKDNQVPLEPKKSKTDELKLEGEKTPKIQLKSLVRKISSEQKKVEPVVEVKNVEEVKVVEEDREPSAELPKEVTEVPPKVETAKGEAKAERYPFANEAYPSKKAAVLFLLLRDAYQTSGSGPEQDATSAILLPILGGDKKLKEFFTRQREYGQEELEVLLTEPKPGGELVIRQMSESERNQILIEVLKRLGTDKHYALIAKINQAEEALEIVKSERPEAFPVKESTEEPEVTPELAALEQERDLAVLEAVRIKSQGEGLEAEQYRNKFSNIILDEIRNFDAVQGGVLRQFSGDNLLKLIYKLTGVEGGEELADRLYEKNGLKIPRQFNQTGDAKILSELFTRTIGGQKYNPSINYSIQQSLLAYIKGYFGANTEKSWWRSKDKKTEKQMNSFLKDKSFRREVFTGAVKMRPFDDFEQMSDSVIFLCIFNEAAKDMELSQNCLYLEKEFNEEAVTAQSEVIIRQAVRDTYLASGLKSKQSLEQTFLADPEFRLEAAQRLAAGLREDEILDLGGEAESRLNEAQKREKGKAEVEYREVLSLQELGYSISEILKLAQESEAMRSVTALYAEEGLTATDGSAKQASDEKVMVAPISGEIDAAGKKEVETKDSQTEVPEPAKKPRKPRVVKREQVKPEAPEPAGRKPLVEVEQALDYDRVERVKLAAAYTLELLKEEEKSFYREQFGENFEKLPDFFTVDEQGKRVLVADKQAAFEQFVETTKKHWQFVVSQMFPDPEFSQQAGERFVALDLDARGALYLLKLAGYNKEKIFFINPGEAREGFINIDTGGQKPLTVVKGGQALKLEEINFANLPDTVYFDHHGAGAAKGQSASKQTFQTLDSLDAFDQLKKDQPESYQALKRTVDFINDADDKIYYDYIGQWEHYPQCLLGLYPLMRAEDIHQLFQSKDFTPLTPLSEEQLENFKTTERQPRAIKAFSEKKAKKIAEAKERLNELVSQGYVCSVPLEGKKRRVLVELEGKLSDDFEASGSLNYEIMVKYKPVDGSFKVSSNSIDLPSELLADQRGVAVRSRMKILPPELKRQEPGQQEISLPELLKLLGVDTDKISASTSPGLYRYLHEGQKPAALSLKAERGKEEVKSVQQKESPTRVERRLTEEDLARTHTIAVTSENQGQDWRYSERWGNYQVKIGDWWLNVPSRKLRQLNEGDTYEVKVGEEAQAGKFPYRIDSIINISLARGGKRIEDNKGENKSSGNLGEQAKNSVKRIKVETKQNLVSVSAGEKPGNQNKLDTPKVPNNPTDAGSNKSPRELKIRPVPEGLKNIGDNKARTGEKQLEEKSSDKPKAKENMLPAKESESQKKVIVDIPGDQIIARSNGNFTLHTFDYQGKEIVISNSQKFKPDKDKIYRFHLDQSELEETGGNKIHIVKLEEGEILDK